MNLSKLFELQRKLDEHIVKEKGLEGQDLLPKKILALQVKLGELAQNWRGFKYWSNDQKPRREKIHYSASYIPLRKSDPLLEEYVDCLHFILSIGLELDFAKFIKDIEPIKNKNITEQFIFIFTKVGTLLAYQGLANYIHIIQNFIGLGEMLGFTWEEIEKAYLERNKISYE